MKKTATIILACTVCLAIILGLPGNSRGDFLLGMFFGLMLGEDGELKEVASPNVIYMDKGWVKEADLDKVMGLIGISFSFDSLNQYHNCPKGKYPCVLTIGERIRSSETVKTLEKEGKRFFPVCIIREGDMIRVFGYTTQSRRR